MSAVLFDEGRKETVLSEILILEHKLTQNPSSGGGPALALCIDPESIWWVSHGPRGQYYLVPHINTRAWSQLTQLFVVGHRSNTSELGAI